MSADIIRFLPEIKQDIEEFIRLSGLADLIFDRKADNRRRAVINTIPTTAETEGIEMFEEMLNLFPMPTDTLEQRRVRIIAKLNERLPYTEIRLRRMLAAICGWEGYELTIDDLVLTLSLTEGNMKHLATIHRMLHDVIPMNVLIQIVQTIERYTKLTLGVGGISAVEISVLPRQIRTSEKTHKMDIKTGFMQNVDIIVMPRKKVVNYRRFNRILATGYEVSVDCEVKPRQTVS